MKSSCFTQSFNTRLVLKCHTYLLVFMAFFAFTNVSHAQCEFTCPDDVLVAASIGKCTQEASWATPSLGSGCAGYSIVFSSHDPGDTFPVGTTTVTYTASNGVTDVTCNFNVIVVDNESPTLSCPANITVSSDPGACVASVSWPDPAVNDNCTGAMITSATHDPGDIFPLGFTFVTYTAEDAYGNTATCTFYVHVIDVTDPQIICPQNITVNNDAGACGANATWTPPSPIDNCLGATVTGSTHNPGDFFPIGTTIVTYDIEDAAGNTTSCSFGVRVNDTETPVLTCPANVTVSTDPGSCQGATVTWDAPTLTDNCTAQISSSTHMSGNFFNLGSTTVTYTAIDASGNQTTCSFEVLVLDMENPTIACPGDITIAVDRGECAAVANWSIPVPMDNCAGVSITAASHNPGDSFPVGMTIVSYTATDAAGNTTDCSFNVTVQDLEAPEFDCPFNVKVPASGNCDAVANWTIPALTDNCPGATITDATHTPGMTFPIGSTTVTYTATDASGNTTTCSFEVLVADTQSPAVACPLDLVVSTDPATCEAVVDFDPPQILDNCGAMVTAQSHNSGDIFPLGTTTVSFEVTDAAGNMSACTFDITVEDNEAPSIVCPADIVINTNPGTCTAQATWDDPVTDDNCPGNLTLDSDYISGNTFDLGTTTVTYTVTDAAGNSTTCDFTVTVVDNEPPVLVCPPNVTVFTTPGTCDAPAEWETPVVGGNTAPSLNDNCPNPMITSVSHNSGDTFPIGSTTVTYTAVDASGNTTECSFEVIVEECMGTGTSEEIALISDQDVFIDGTSFGANTPYLFTDPATPASATLSNITLQLFFRVNGNSCESDIKVRVTDPAGNATVFNNIFTGCLGPAGGLFTQTLQIPSASTTGTPADWVIEFRDSNDQNAGVEYTVRFGRLIYDVMTGADGCANPIIINCPAAINVVNEPGLCGAYVDVPVPQFGVDFTDCFNATISNDYNNTNDGTGFYPAGTTLVTWTVTDAQGNTTSCIQVIEVEDVEAPTITCPQDLSVNTGLSVCNAAVIWNAPEFSDNCPGIMVSSNFESGDVFELGTTTVTYTVTDAAGNTADCSFTVTVIDFEPPAFFCPEDVTAFTTPGTCDAMATWDLPTFVDNCGTAEITGSSHNPGDTFPIGTTQVTYTVIDDAGNENTCTFNVIVEECTSESVTETVTIISDEDLFVGENDTQSFAGNGVYTFTDVGTSSGATLTNIRLQLFFRVFGNSCESDIAVRLTDPAGNVTNFTNIFNTCDGTGPLYQRTLVVTTAATTGNADDWVVEFRDTNDQNPGQREYSVRFGRLFYDATIGGDGCDDPIIVNCPADITGTNETGFCGRAFDIPVPQFGTDFTDCSSATIINDYTGTSDGSAFYPVGTTFVTWTVTDDQGNTATCIQTITVTDITLPVVTCPANVVIPTTSGLCTGIATWQLPTFFDNCSPATITSTHNSGDVFPIGTTTVSYTVFDPSGNSATCSFTVTVEDKEAPVLACPENLTVFTSPGTCDAVAQWDMPGLTDNCPGASITSASHTSGSTFPIGATTITYTAVDAAGNTTECSFDVIVEECAGNAVTETITLISDQDVYIGVADTENFNDNLPYLFPDSSPAGATITNATLQLFFRVAGNSCESDMEVQITDPAGNVNVFTGIFASCNGEAGGLYSTTLNIPNAATNGGGQWTVQFRDNNDQNPVSAGVPSPNNPPGTEYTVRFGRIVYQSTTGEDGCAIPIIANCPADVSANSQSDICGAFVDIPVPQYGVDFTDCFPATIVNDFTGTSDASGLYPVGTTVVTWTVTDQQGNTATCLQVVTVTDVTPPLITCPDDVVVSTAQGTCDAVAVWPQPEFSDNCPGPVVTSSVPSGSTFLLGTTTVTYSITDLSGNTTTCDFTVTVEDNEAPEVTCPADVTVFTTPGSCDAVAEWTLPTITDNCDASPEITGESHASGSTFPIGTTTVSYTVEDDAGNVSTCSFDVIVEECTGTAVTETITLISDMDVFVGQADTETFGDNVPYLFTDPGTPASSTISNITLQLFFRVNGNSCESDIEVQVTDPAGNVVYVGTPFATCNGAAGGLYIETINIPTANTTGAVANWTVEFRDTNDQNAGVEEYTARFGRLIYDTTTSGPTSCATPVIVNCPADITIDGLGTDCSTPVDIPEPVFGTDFTDCFNTVATNDYTGTSDASGLYPVGTTSVTWTFTDEQGNTATCIQTIVITDTGDPEVVCPDDIVSSTDAGECGANVFWNPPVADDNCGAQVMSQTHTPGDFFGIGTTTVTYVIQDAAGNMTECSFDITVEDTEAPTIVCPSDILVTFDNRDCDAIVTWDDPTVSDNCPGANITNSTHSSGEAFMLGTTEVAYEVTDAVGNVSTCSFEVTVVDNEAPTIINCPPDIEIDGPPGECEAAVTIPVPMFGTDFSDCQEATMASNDYNSSSNASDTYPVGTTVVTWTFTDPSGNSVACQQTITVIEQNLETDAVLVTDKDVFVGAGMDNADFNESDSILIFDPGVPANATVNSVILDFFFRPEGNSCERDVEVEVTDPAGNVFPVFAPPVTTCTGNDAIFQFTLPLASVPTAASGGGDWKLRFRDTQEQNPVSAGPPFIFTPAGTEYSVRFGRITYDITIDPDCDTAVPCASGGIISAFDDTTICVGDGEADELIFTRTSQLGANDGWLITDNATGEILSPGVVAQGMSQFTSPDLDGAGVGVCTVYSVSWNGTLSNADMGDNVEDIMASDCFALSNPININRVDCPGIVIEEDGFDTIGAPANDEMTLYPVPTTSMLNVDYIAQNDENLYIQILNVNGKVMQVQQENALQGTNTYQVDVINLLGGMYYVKVVSDTGKMQVKPFTKITP